MSSDDLAGAAKVPPATALFWFLKIIATTLGETAGDAVSLSMQLGYLRSTLLFAALFSAAVATQITASRFHPFRYWLTLMATTTLGTTLADFADRSLGMGYPGGSALLLLLLLGCLGVWHGTLGTVATDNVRSRREERWYWTTLMASQTLGTALGDWAADSAALGYGGAMRLFALGLGMVAVAYYATRWSRTLLFWMAFILTRPLGAVVGDFLDKSPAEGGLGLSRYTASLALLAIMDHHLGTP